MPSYSRYGISNHRFEGEADSADSQVIAQGRADFQVFLESWPLEQVFNCDETGLFFRLGPSTTLATSRVKGVKRDKERLTILFTANAMGTVKRRPLIIGKSARPRCYKNVNMSMLSVDYFSNPKAWMRGDIWTTYLSKWDAEIAHSTRTKILLLTDNATSHIDVPNLKYIEVRTLPPNTTAHLQPMDAGIIRTFKAYYRRNIVEQWVTVMEGD
ncbi:DDE superfamily endonuclease-domain-containing protein, partial [Jimgerdemannia flammicorona]